MASTTSTRHARLFLTSQHRSETGTQLRRMQSGPAPRRDSISEPEWAFAVPARSVEKLTRQAHSREAETLEGPPHPSDDGPGGYPSLRPRPANVLVAGDLVADRYVVTDILGSGGMGIVYCCNDKLTGDLVALKRVTSTDGPRAQRRRDWFETEALALSLLDHPNIVAARDFGQLADGSPFIVMNVAHGKSLHHLSNETLSFPTIWAIVDQILDALAHAHARGVVHADLKPSNVIVQHRESIAPFVTLVDFGLARVRPPLAGPLFPADARPGHSRLTVGAGTPGYMAPEQASQHVHDICGATDLFSLACILYKLLDGRSAFPTVPDPAREAYRYVSPAPLEPTERVPDGVVEFVMRCLSENPSDRFELAADARHAWAECAPPKGPYARLWDALNTPLDTLLQGNARARSSSRVLARTRPAPARAGGLLRIRPAPLVGHLELRETLILHCRKVAAEGTPGCAVLAGPAGIGKSRIGGWLAEVMHEQGEMIPLVVRFRAEAAADHGIRDAVRRFYHLQDAERSTIERTLLARWRVSPNDLVGGAWVAATSTWLGPRELPRIGQRTERAQCPCSEIEQLVERFALEQIASSRPLLLVFDDLHLASKTALQHALQLCQFPGKRRGLTLAIARTQDGVLQGSLKHFATALDAKVFAVNALDHAATCELVRASHPVDACNADAIARRSGGVPFVALRQLHAHAKHAAPGGTKR